MKFWLGTHMPNWLATDEDLFVSRRRLWKRKTFPVAAGAWALDSGGFTELKLHGGWNTTEDRYVADVLLYEREIGGLAWAAPMDWMCEPFVLEKTGLTVVDHQERTVDNFIRLRDRLGPVVIPVLQGWELDDYKACWAMYDFAGVDLEREPLVGVGSVCRRQDTLEVALIFRLLHDWGLRLHGFGIKTAGLSSFRDTLASADSMSWSYQARREHALIGCNHKACTNCLRYARRWRTNVGYILNQTRLEFA